MENIRSHEVLPVNRRAKDTFFKTVYATEERQRALASFLLGVDGEKITIANVRPVLFGNKENDLAFECDDVFYLMTENQASVSPNVPYRLLEYITAGLRSTVDSERLLYGGGRVYFPVPKLYMLQTGLEITKEKLPKQVQYDIRLSDSYRHVSQKYGKMAAMPDLDVIVHVYDFRMTLDETVKYIEQNIMPDRFMAYDNDLRNYAFTANGITYIQRAVKDDKHKKYIVPINVSTVTEYLSLLIERNIFVDLLTDKEVCDMTMAQFSRDDMLIYQGREEGREEGRAEGKAEGKAEAIIDLLSDIGELPDSLENLIMKQTDAQTLQKWLKTAARADSIKEFEKSIGLISLER